MRGVLVAARARNFLTYSFLFLLVACGGSSSSSPSLTDLKNSQVLADPQADRVFSTDQGEYRIISRKKLEELVANGEIKRLLIEDETDENFDPNQLFIGLPKSILGQEHYFGAIVTEVSDKENEDYGRLKMTDLEPAHVYPRLDVNAETQAMTLVLEGCTSECTLDSTQRNKVQDFPVSGQDEERIYVDFAKVGGDLNLIEIYDPAGVFFNLKGLSSRTVEVSYSHDTLIFDVRALMEEIPVTQQLLQLLFPFMPQFPGFSESPEEPKKVEITTKWFLKRRYENPHFKPQVATEGVGYFMTHRYVDKFIQKHAHMDARGRPQHVHYFVKNVPEEFKAAYKQGFEDWNDVFQEHIGIRLLTYEFVDADDAFAPLVTAGDIRINVLEWDLVNQAPYGGLGPSIADQKTGAQLSSNTLIQGPAIVSIYTEWFQVNREAQALREAGLESRADSLLKEARNRLYEEKKSAREGKKFAMALNESLLFNVRSQDPRLMDEMAKLDFELVPANLSYEEYMYGYFVEIVAHEIGHNLGLRHNFKGNLFAANEAVEGKVSASIMEYLSRPYRNLNRIAEYDNIAIAYGYAGVDPYRRDMFCTDEHVGNLKSKTGSAECSRDDAENNPYEQLTERLIRTRDLFVGNGNADAPVWSKGDILPHFNKYADGLLLYAESAERSMDSWLRFFAFPERPKKEVADIQAFVLKTFNKVACDKALEESLVEQKGGLENLAAQAALKNLYEFRSMSQTSITSALGEDFASALECIVTPPAEETDIRITSL